MADDERSAMDVLRGSRILAYSVGIISFAAGVALLVWTDRSITLVGRVAGILILVVGLSEVWDALITHRKGSYWGLFLLRGVINLGFGAALVFWPNMTVTVLVWLFGLDLVITAVIALVLATQVPKDYGRGGLVLRGVVGGVFGVMIMAWPDVTLNVVAVLIALQLLLLGVVLLWSGWQLGKAENDLVEA